MSRKPVTPQFSNKSIPQLSNKFTPTLGTLPKEIIYHITDYLDKTSLIQLSRVSRAFVPYADDRLWLHLDLHVRSWDEKLFIPDWDPDLDSKVDKLDWVAHKLEQVEQDYHLRMRQMVKTISCKADERRWKLVRSVKVIPTIGSVHAVLTVLDYTSSNLERLEIYGLGPDEEQICWPESHQSLDHVWLSNPIPFPLLTYLCIGDGAIRNVDFPLLIISGSPNLIEVHIDLNRSAARYGFNERPPVDYPSFDTTTKIRRLKFVFGDLDDYHDHTDIFARNLFDAILAFSPSMEKLVLDCSSDREQTKLRLMETINSSMRLDVDLFWSIGVFELASLQKRLLTPNFGCRRVILGSRHWADEGLPSILDVESIYLDRTKYRWQYEFRPSKVSSETSSHIAAHSVVKTLMPDFAHSVRGNPKLYKFHILRRPPADIDENPFGLFDSLAISGEEIGFISSMTRDSSEVLHLHLLLDWMEVDDVISLSPRPDLLIHDLGQQSNPSTKIQYKDYNGTIREKSLIWTPTPIWQTFTDFEGRAVPLEIIEKMREVEAAGLDIVWKRRGVEMGEEAWTVLTDWYASVSA